MTPANRARLLALLSFPVVIGIAVAIRHLPRGDDALGWVSLAEILFLIGVYVNAYRQEHHLTWRELLPRVVAVGVGYAILVVGITIVAWLYAAIRANWQSVGPILAVVGVSIAVLGIVLLVLYLVVRVVRVAWKGR